VPHFVEILTTPAVEHPVHKPALQPIFVFTIPGVAETFKIVFDQIAYGTDFQIVNTLDGENVKLTHEDVNTSSDEQEKWLNIHHLSDDILSFIVKTSSNG